MGRKLRKFRKNENPNSTSYIKNLNNLIEEVKRANNLSLNINNARGGIINTPKGHNLSITIPKFSKANFIGGGSGGGGGTTIKRMVCAEDAPAGNIIKCNFFDSNGHEITTGTEGIDYNVEVWCNISNGPVAQVERATPANVETNDVFTLTCTNGGVTDSVSYTATADSVSNVCNGLANAWNAEASEPFVNITATNVSGFYIRLTADNRGDDFILESSTTNGGATDDQTLEITNITENSEYGDLNQAIPRLKEGDQIICSQFYYSLDPTETNPSASDQTYWTCLTTLSASEPCECQ